MLETDYNISMDKLFYIITMSLALCARLIHARETGDTEMNTSLNINELSKILKSCESLGLNAGQPPAGLPLGRSIIDSEIIEEVIVGICGEEYPDSVYIKVRNNYIGSMNI